MAKPLSRKAAQTKGALLVFLRPLIAQDAKLDLNPLLAGINNSNYGEKKAKLGEDIKAACKDKLAKDASIEGVVQLLDALEEVTEPEGIDGPAPGSLEANSAIPIHDEEGPAKAREFLAGKLSAEDMATYDSLFPPKKAEGMDAETDEEKAAREKKEAADKAAADAAEEEKKNMVTKPVMDAAIKLAADNAAKAAETATIARLKAVREAEREVRPYIGELAIAQDSAEGVYKLALDHLKVDLTDVPASAYRAVLKTIPVPGTKKAQPLGQDAAAAASFASRYPDAGRIGHLG